MSNRRLLLETTMENMSVLKDCTDAIIRAMPMWFGYDKYYRIWGDEFASYFTDVLKKYKDTPWYGIINNLLATFFEVTFTNTIRASKITTFGSAESLIGRPTHSLTFNISGFIGDSRDITKPEVLAHRRPDIPIQSFRAIVLHELRHFFQSYLYTQYYNLERRPEEYKSNPLEVDAAWNHNLLDFDPKEFSTAAAYAEAVMASFGSYKTLTSTQQAHYRRKTLRYYMETTGRTMGDDPLATRLDIRTAEFGSQTRQRIVRALTQLDGYDYDLRKLPGYNPESKRFLLPNRAINGTAAAINKDAPISSDAAAIAYLIVGLITPPDRVKEFQRHLTGVQKVGLNTALSKVKSTFSDGWDADAIKAYIGRVFG